MTADPRDLPALARHIRKIGDDAEALYERRMAEGVPEPVAWAEAKRYEEHWTRDLFERYENEQPDQGEP